ncbi:MAG: ATPase, T2SS/T4P/T4SS family [Candidatus Micrarchaeota archaeon]
MPSAYLENMLRKAKTDKPSLPVGDEKPKDALQGKRVLLDSYGDVKIYREEGEPLLLYEVPSPHYYGTEKMLIDALLQIAIGVLPLDVEALTTEEKRKRYFEKVMEIIEQTPELKVPPNSKEFYANAVVRDMVGYGLIDPLVNDDKLEEIMIIGHGKPVYVFHRKHEMLRTNITFYEDIDVRNLIDRIARAIGRRIDTQVPLLDARLPDGTRVNATLPPASIDGATLTLRKFKKDPMSVIDLINVGTLNYEIAAFLWLATDGAGAYPANILIAGGTASGKTTTLNVVSSFIPRAERIVSIEDTAELSLPLTHWIRCEVRPPSVEGTGEITMNDLVSKSLRRRPDRILVGEIRGPEG